VALVGVTEKTAISLDLDVAAAGGHASMPPAETAVGILACAIDRIDANPMPAAIAPPLDAMFSTLAPYMTWPMRTAVANLWFARPLVLRELARSPDSNALIRTTMAPTMIQGSDKSNVLPTRAHAVVNVRLMPGDTADDVVRHVVRAVNDPRVSVAVENAARHDDDRPAAVAASTGADFALLARSIRAVYPDAIVAPFITMGATDARRYRDVAANAYRIVPVHQAHAVDELHGVDEHIQLDVYERQIRTYATLIEQWAGSEP
jgi:carboxypeptidase PM20D1